MIVEIINKMIPKEYITEFSRDQNQFTSTQLMQARVLIVSDFEQLSRAQKDIIKRVLGRDTLTMEEKNVTGIQTFQPYCQVIFVSNLAPSAFKELLKDQAVLDKLIILEYFNDEQIPASLQVADLRENIEFLVPHLVNWAVYAPRELLQLHVRAIAYNQFLKQQASFELPRGYPSFVENSLWYEVGAFLPVNEILKEADTYAKTTGDDAMLTKALNSPLARSINSPLARSNSSHLSILVKCCHNYF